MGQHWTHKCFPTRSKYACINFTLSTSRLAVLPGRPAHRGRLPPLLPQGGPGPGERHLHVAGVPRERHPLFRVPRPAVPAGSVAADVPEPREHHLAVDNAVRSGDTAGVGGQRTHARRSRYQSVK